MARSSGARGASPNALFVQIFRRERVIEYASSVETDSMESPLPAPVNLNAVRLETLHGAVVDLCGRFALRVGSPPEWCDHDERACWGFALGQVAFALEQALGRAYQESSGAPLHAVYRCVQASVVQVARVCRRDSAMRDPYDLAAAAALALAADELMPIVRHADRAPGWVRRRARRVASRVDSR